MSVPADFLDEIDRELREGCGRLTGEAFRLSQPVELHGRALDASLQRGRAVSVVDVLADASDEEEQRIVTLVRSLRGDDT
ncbi:MAG TPA: hypothetical protein VI540_07250 [Gaiellaceae bacterium]|nr:hypothetical protein [Gaiellaceae bacterium]